MYNKNILKNNKAFTLVETLVAISIFTSAILGLLSLTAGNISDTAYARDKIVANYLAMEGVEYMRNLRDTYVLFESNGWENFKTKLAPCVSLNGCWFNADNNSGGGVINYASNAQPIKAMTITVCAPNCNPLLYDATSLNKKYNYTTGSTTTFRRKIQIKEVPNASSYNKELYVTSTVSWKTKGKDYNVSFSNYLKNWAE